MIWRINKPVFQRIPFTDNIFSYTRLRIAMNFQKRMWYIQFTLYHFLQNTIFYNGNNLHQKLFNSPCMLLKCLDKLIQIFYKFIFVNNKFNRFHQMIRLPRIKIPKIILVILIEPLKIFLKKAPPFINLFQTCMFHSFSIFKTFLHADEKICR